MVWLDLDHVKMMYWMDGPAAAERSMYSGLFINVLEWLLWNTVRR